MTRRAVFGTLPFLTASSKRPKAIKPAVLKPGDLVGMITPASNVPDPDESYPKLERNMAAMGLKVRFGKSVRQHSGYIAGP